MSKYPVSPRLSPDGTYYICDECKLEWKPGEQPICVMCIVAWVELESKKEKPDGTPR